MSDQQGAKRREIEMTLLAQKALEDRAFKIVQQLVVDKTSVTEEELCELVEKLMPGHYEDIVEERSIIKLCGLPLCSNTLHNIPKQKYILSHREKAVYDITKRKISSSPLWLRTTATKPTIATTSLQPSNIRYCPGELVCQTAVSTIIDELKQLELLDNIKEQPTTNNGIDNASLQHNLQQQQQQFKQTQKRQETRQQHPQQHQQSHHQQKQTHQLKQQQQEQQQEHNKTRRDEFEANNDKQDEVVCNKFDDKDLVVLDQSVESKQNQHVSTPDNITSMKPTGCNEGNLWLLHRKVENTSLPRRADQDDQGMISDLDNVSISLCGSSCEDGDSRTDTNSNSTQMSDDQSSKNNKKTNIAELLSRRPRGQFQRFIEEIPHDSTGAPRNTDYHMSKQAGRLCCAESKGVVVSAEPQGSIVTDRLRTVLSEWMTQRSVQFINNDDDDADDLLSSCPTYNPAVVDIIMSDRVPLSGSTVMNTCMTNEKDNEVERNTKISAGMPCLLGMNDLNGSSAVRGADVDCAVGTVGMNEERVSYELRIREFYGNSSELTELDHKSFGCTVEHKESLKITGKNMKKSGVDRKANQQITEQSSTGEANKRIILPPVDKHSQMFVRRKIVLDKLSHSLVDLEARSLLFVLPKIRKDLIYLVNTFDFSPTNILLKAHEWTLMIICLLSLLAQRRRPHLSESLSSLPLHQHILQLTGGCATGSGGALGSASAPRSEHALERAIGVTDIGNNVSRPMTTLTVAQLSDLALNVLTLLA